MRKIDWSAAPDGAECFAYKLFWKAGAESGVYFWFNGQEWAIDAVGTNPFLSDDCHVKQKEWPTDDRINNIGLNRTTEDTGHYEQAEVQQPKTSADFLSACIQVQSQRAKQYDATGTGERSFQAAASAFNAVTGKDLKGSDVCLILEMVKLVRQYSSPDRLHDDSVLDKVSYSALWAEQLASELMKDKEQ